MGMLERWRRTDRGTTEKPLARSVSSVSAALSKLPPTTGLTEIRACVNRSQVTVAGVVISVASVQGPPAAEFAVEIDDGTGTLVLVWRGRSTVPGIRPGILLIAKGTTGKSSGLLLKILDPHYSIQVVD